MEGTVGRVEGKGLLINIANKAQENKREMHNSCIYGLADGAKKMESLKFHHAYAKEAVSATM